MIASWNEGNDPTSVVILDVNMQNQLDYIKEINESDPTINLRPVHIFTHALAWGLYKMRKDVGRCAIGSFKHSKKVGISSLIDVDGLTVPLTFWNVHTSNLVDFARQYNELEHRA